MGCWSGSIFISVGSGDEDSLIFNPVFKLVDQVRDAAAYGRPTCWKGFHLDQNRKNLFRMEKRKKMFQFLESAELNPICTKFPPIEGKW